MVEQRKIVLITGAARGIGKAIALKFCQEDNVVILIDIDENLLLSTKEEFIRAGYNIHAFVTDVSNPEQVALLSKKIKKENIEPDIVVNNAGIARDNFCIRMRIDDWQQVMNVNINSVFLLSKEFVKTMLKKRWGRIINITSVVAFTGNSGQVNYAASKAAVVGFTRSLAKEIAKRNITVNAVAPGYIDTEMTAKLPDNVKNEIMNFIPLKKYGKPEDIANTVAFLASEAASYITGQVIHVNGGLFM